MKMKLVLPSLLVALMFMPADLRAESKATRAERQLANELSAALVLVAAESSKFADVRDQLARTRLRTLQGLENNLIWIQEGNDFTVREWQVIGEDYRVKLFHDVLETTEQIAARRAAAAERQAGQQRELAATQSAVSRKSSQLSSAAASLAALAEPPVSGLAVSNLVRGALGQLATSLAEENPKLSQGLKLADKTLGVVESRLGRPK